MKKVFLHVVPVVLAGLLALASMVFFTVDQRYYALLFQMGEVKLTITEPGLHLKWPLIQNVRVFDKRVLTIDSQDPELFITSEKKNVQVDSYVKWRIVDPELYYVSVGGDESRASTRLMQTINAGLRAEFGTRTVRQVISDEREKIMEDMRVKANEDAKKIGVLVLDVRLKRVELPTNVADSVYERMRSERKQVANQLRAEGAKQYETTRAIADRKRVELLAQAYNAAQKIMGDGDAQAAAIYAKAFSRDPEFYAFYRSMEAYRETFKSKQDVLVVEPNSDFFRYLKNAR
ncbi:MAG: protease modulator HflC [Zoogloeaceae bacterium]|jgi:membrane protease subunit HflC|nr:protease modulator HflC [Zoogloeaceae bacterium]